jgi:hypothetical protein
MSRPLNLAPIPRPLLPLGGEGRPHRRFLQPVSPSADGGQVRGSRACPGSFAVHHSPANALGNGHRAQTPAGSFRPQIRIAENIRIISSQALKPVCER